MERNDKCFCGSGKKYKKCHYHISGESKLADMYRKNAAFDEVCNNLGIGNTCINGCSECCKDYFFVSENEFLMIVEELLHRGENIKLYMEKAQKNKKIIAEKHPELLEKLEKIMPSGGRECLNSSYFRDNENPRDLPACIFLNGQHKCSIYNVRPFICRTYGTTEVCQFLSNNHIPLQEQINMMENTIIRSDDNQSIMKRPYPLFYWFSEFLKKPYDFLTLTKVEKIKNNTEKEFYNFNRQLH